MAAHTNIANSILNNSPIVVGKNNAVIVSSDSEIDWKYIQRELEDACKKLSNNTLEYIITKEAADCAKKKDKNGFKDILKKYSVWFCSDVFKGIVSGGIVEIIKSLIV